VSAVTKRTLAPLRSKGRVCPPHPVQPRLHTADEPELPADVENPTLGAGSCVTGDARARWGRPAQACVDATCPPKGPVHTVEGSGHADRCLTRETPHEIGGGGIRCFPGPCATNRKAADVNDATGKRYTNRPLRG
jgi:hypothetical protein